MAQESEVVRIARQYREQLARNEDAIMRDMAKHWARMERQLYSEYVTLAQQMQELSDNGIAIPKQMIYTQRRYIEMMSQIDKYLAQFDTYTVQVITDYQRKDYILGLDDAKAQIKRSMPDAPRWNQVANDTAETMAGFAGNGAPLGDLLRRDYGDLGERVTDALVTGIGLGKGALAVARDIENAVSMEYDRALRIARTETNRAYRLANAEQYRKSGVVEKVLRLCYPPTACLACLELDGEECPNGICDDHPNGKCTTIAVTIGGNYPDWQHGHDWLMEQSEEDQRRIIGAERYELWKNNGISLRDMVRMNPNPIWGGSPTIISVKDLKAQNNIGTGDSPI